MPTIRIDDEVLRFLQSHAEPFKDTPNDVLRRVLLPPSVQKAIASPRKGAVTNGVSAPARAMSFRPDADYAYKRVSGYWLLGDHHVARSFHDVLLGSARELQKQHPKEFEAAALCLHGRKRAYFSRDGQDLKRASDLGGGLFVEANLSADSIVGVCRALLTALGRDPDELRLEVV
jgi:negative regulator of replication initiation